MTGLEIEISSRKHGKKSMPNEKFSIVFIANLLGISYQAIKRKLENNKFWGDEERAIFYTIIPQKKQTLELYNYLFTEQRQKEDKWTK